MKNSHPIIVQAKLVARERQAVFFDFSDCDCAVCGQVYNPLSRTVMIEDTPLTVSAFWMCGECGGHLLEHGLTPEMQYSIRVAVREMQCEISN